MTEHLNQCQILIVYPSTHYPMHTHCKNTVLKIDYISYNLFSTQKYLKSILYNQ